MQASCYYVLCMNKKHQTIYEVDSDFVADSIHYASQPEIESFPSISESAEQERRLARRVIPETFEGQKIPFNLHEPIRRLLAERDELKLKVRALEARLGAVKARRDELLAAAKRVEHSWHITRRKTLASSMAHLRAAIANAKGKSLNASGN